MLSLVPPILSMIRIPKIFSREKLKNSTISIQKNGRPEFCLGSYKNMLSKEPSIKLKTIKLSQSIGMLIMVSVLSML